MADVLEQCGAVEATRGARSENTVLVTLRVAGTDDFVKEWPLVRLSLSFEVLD